MTGAWLFVRGEESIWLQRIAPDAVELDMHGPLSLRRHCTFSTDAELRAFVEDVTARLTPAGWTLQRFEPGHDRRRASRGDVQAAIPERRQPGTSAAGDT